MMVMPTGSQKPTNIAINNTAYSILRSIWKCSCMANIKPTNAPIGMGG